MSRTTTHVNCASRWNEMREEPRQAQELPPELTELPETIDSMDAIQAVCSMVNSVEHIPLLLKRYPEASDALLAHVLSITDDSSLLFSIVLSLDEDHLIFVSRTISYLTNWCVLNRFKTEEFLLLAERCIDPSRNLVLYLIEWLEREQDPYCIHRLLDTLGAVIGNGGEFGNLLERFLSVLLSALEIPGMQRSVFALTSIMASEEIFHPHLVTLATYASISDDIDDMIQGREALVLLLEENPHAADASIIPHLLRGFSLLPFNGKSITVVFPGKTNNTYEIAGLRKNPRWFWFGFPIL